MTTSRVSQHREFLESLKSELQLVREAWLIATDELRADTLYFGGGTPSLVSEDLLEDLIELLRTQGWITDDCWFFLEANPEDITQAKLGHWRDLGIRTISLGVQALNDQALAWLGREHDTRVAIDAIGLVKGYLDRVSLDLIYGLPDQEGDDWRRDLETAIRLEPHHLSCYQLTIHAPTPFGRRQAHGEVLTAAEDTLASLFRLTHTTLNDGGYRGYEVSNFARAREYRSQHNQKYWDHGPYLGLGPGAHSFYGQVRRWNESGLTQWQGAIARAALPVAGEEHLSREQLMLEYVMLKLRTSDGIRLSEYADRFGVELTKSNERTIEALCDQELIRLTDDRLVPTMDGLALADTVATQFNLAG